MRRTHEDRLLAGHRRASGLPGAGVGLPVGNGAALGNGGVSLIPDVEASREFGRWLPSAELSGIVRPGVSLGNEQTYGSEIDAAAAVAYELGALRPELVGRAFFPFGGLPVGGQILAGARHQTLASLDIFALAGVGFGPLVGVPALQVVIGAAFDGGQHAAAPPSPPPVPVIDPCSAGQTHTSAQCPALDDDGDGIPNRDDRCPLVAGPAKYEGCPPPDRDHDGIPDDEDRCPDQPGPAATHGCPDRDHDGVPDAEDECPDAPGPAATHGCPDRDGDGVPDRLDNCPDEPGPASNQGCPPKKKQLVVITREKLEIRDHIYFDTGKGRIQKRSFGLLDQIASVIRAHPEIPLVEIQGHTDAQGRPALNKKLSELRAEAVRRYLAGKGVAADRLRAKGYGMERPIASNATAAGRAQNRRVDFVIVGDRATDGGAPQAVPLVPAGGKP